MITIFASRCFSFMLHLSHHGGSRVRVIRITATPAESIAVNREAIFDRCENYLDLFQTNIALKIAELGRKIMFRRVNFRMLTNFIIKRVL